MTLEKHFYKEDTTAQQYSGFPSGCLDWLFKKMTEKYIKDSLCQKSNTDNVSPIRIIKNPDWNKETLGLLYNGKM